MPAITIDRSSPAQSAIVYLITLAALALLAWVLAYWTWTWFAPRPEARAQTLATPVAGITASPGLFGNVQRGQPAAAPTGIAVKLLGIAAATPGRRGYALMQLDAKETRAVRVGDNLAPDIRLAEVHKDHVILERNGIRESLVWPQKSATPSPAVVPVNK